MSQVLDVIAGWGLADGIVDGIEPFVAADHLELVREQRLTGVLLAAMRAGDVVVDDPDAVVRAHRQAMVDVLHLEDVLLDTCELLADAGIAPIVLKGAALAHLRPDPAERVFGDTDLLVPPDRLPDAVAALEAVGAVRVHPPVSATWERRFAKSVTLRWRRSEIDLHRTLAPGPYGHLIDLTGLLAAPARLEIAGVGLATLDPEHHLVHAAIHAALGDVTPRRGSLRDIAVLLERTDLDLDRVMASVAAWRVDAPFASGLRSAASIGARHPLVDWAEDHRASRRDRRLSAGYDRRDGRFRRQALASLTVLPWRDRPAFVRALVGRRRG